MNRIKIVFLKMSVCIFLVLFLSGCPEMSDSGVHSTTVSQKNSSSRTKSYYQWQDNSIELVIRYNHGVKELIWNDPSVLKDNGQYRMWMSGGKIADGGKDVKIYTATSNDGMDWKINPKPLLSHGEKGLFDEKGVETPSVIKVGDLFHMYYTGSNYQDSHMGRFSIGHATSKDGIRWTKDIHNPVIPRTNNGKGPGEGKPNAWGWLSVAEPGVVYHEASKTFYLYYVATKLRYDDYSGAEPKIIMGIMLATSKDGSQFSFQSEPVLIQSSAYPHNKGYYGYSTPSAHIDASGKIHLYYDVAQYVNKKRQFVQTSLVHAVSSDGFSFQEMDYDIIQSGQGGWMNEEVRAPSAIETDDGGVLLYFAGGWAKGGIGLIKAQLE